MWRLVQEASGVTTKFADPQINYYVEDVEIAVCFYSEHFGFVETFRTPTQGTPEHVELRLGPLVLGLASREAGRTVHGLPLGAAGNPRAELVLWTDDVDEVYARLVEKGVPSVSPPHDFLSSLRSAWVMDPDGNPVEIVTRRVAQVASPAGE
jgi:catechol 2,3-dioxygenase-like lactoylglutathione lyase family enzyme